MKGLVTALSGGVYQTAPPTLSSVSASNTDDNTGGAGCEDNYDNTISCTITGASFRYDLIYQVSVDSGPWIDHNQIASDDGAASSQTDRNQPAAGFTFYKSDVAGTAVTFDYRILVVPSGGTNVESLATYNASPQLTDNIVDCLV